MATTDKSTFSIMFHLRSDRIDETSTAPVFMRVTVNGERIELSTNRRFDTDRWENGQPKGNRPDAEELRKYMVTLQEKVFKIQRDLIDHHEEITAEIVKKRYLGIDEKSKTLLEVFDHHNEYMKKLIGRDFAKATYKRFETTRRHICEFIQEHYHKDDILLSQLKYIYYKS